jgi:L-amino acid N-acyltransferase YncA
MEALVKEPERAGIWMLQTSIFPENGASIAIHEACGFRKVGYREWVSQLRGVWRDTVFMERRSKVVGV